MFFIFAYSNTQVALLRFFIHRTGEEKTGLKKEYIFYL